MLFHKLVAFLEEHSCAENMCVIPITKQLPVIKQLPPVVNRPAVGTTLAVMVTDQSDLGGVIVWVCATSVRFDGDSSVVVRDLHQMLLSFRTSSLVTCVKASALLV